MTDAPAPGVLALVVVVVLALSGLVLVHQERAYEHDPQLRAQAGLVNATSDISLMRPAAFGRALGIIATRLPPGGRIRGMSVTPAQVEVTLQAADGSETDLAISP